jgi:hypothetical protein
LVGPAQHRLGPFQVVPQALVPPGRARLFQRSREIRGGGRAGRARAGDDQVKRHPVQAGFGPLAVNVGVNLAHRRLVGLLLPAVGPGDQDRRRAVPAGRAAHRRPGGPLAADPHRYPRPLHGGRQERHVLDDHVLAVEGHRLPRPQQVQRLQPLVQARGEDLSVGGLAEAAELVCYRGAQAHAEDHPAAGEPVEGGDLPGQLGHPPPGHRRDHRAEPDPPRGQRRGGQQHPRIRDRAPQLLAVSDVIPDEQPVPAGVLGTPRQVSEHAGVGEVTEVRHVDGVAHDLMLARPAGSARGTLRG